MTNSYPELTSYQFASNRPVDGIDIDGKEWAQSVKVNMNSTTIQIETDFIEKVNVINQSTIVTDPNVIKAKAELYKVANENKFKGDFTYYLGSIIIKLKYKTDVVLDFTQPSADAHGELAFDDRKTVKTSTSTQTFKAGIISNTTTTTTVTTEDYVAGITDGQINDFKISIGITKDGNIVSNDDFTLTSQHENGHSAGLNHPFKLSMFEKKLMPELNQGDKLSKPDVIKNNLMNSADNPDPALRNNYGSELTPAQLNVMSQKIKLLGANDPADLKLKPAPKSN